MDSRFQHHPDSEILQKYQLLSNQWSKHNSADMSSLYSTATFPFESRFRMFIINGYCTKSKCLQSLDPLLFFQFDEVRFGFRDHLNKDGLIVKCHCHRKIHSKTPVSESFFNKVAGLDFIKQKKPTHMLSRAFCEQLFCRT